MAVAGGRMPAGRGSLASRSWRAARAAWIATGSSPMLTTPANPGDRVKAGRSSSVWWRWRPCPGSAGPTSAHPAGGDRRAWAGRSPRGTASRPRPAHPGSSGSPPAVCVGRPRCWLRPVRTWPSRSPTRPVFFRDAMRGLPAGEPDRRRGGPGPPAQPGPCRPRTGRPAHVRVRCRPALGRPTRRHRCWSPTPGGDARPARRPGVHTAVEPLHGGDRRGGPGRRAPSAVTGPQRRADRPRRPGRDPGGRRLVGPAAWFGAHAEELGEAVAAALHAGGPVGVMLHHAVMDDGDRHGVRALVDLVVSSPRRDGDDDHGGADAAADGGDSR